MKGIIETSVYLVIFALVCFFSIDFIRINQRVSDAGEISQYIENYIEAYCGDIPDDFCRSQGVPLDKHFGAQKAVAVALLCDTACRVSG